MEIHYDEIVDKIMNYFIENQTFGNRYFAKKLPDIPKPNLILLDLSKEPVDPIGFVILPPHAMKREYLTGLSNSISYLLHFPIVYLVLPDEIVDGIHIPTFISDIISVCDLEVGIMSYDISTFIPTIFKEAVTQENVSNPITEGRTWLFWMDTSLEEVAQMLKKINEIENRNQKFDKNSIMDEFWNEYLIKRYPKSNRPSSFKLNYKLFFDTLNLWTLNGKLTIIGNRIHNICKKYGEKSIEFKNGLHYVILTTGGYLKMLLLINEIQNLFDYDNKGNKDDLTKIIEYIYQETQDKQEIIRLYNERAPDCWYKMVGMKLYELGYGKTLTQLNEELEKRFGTYFQKKLVTDFYLSDYIKHKGFIINWKRVLTLITNGEKNLGIF